MSADNSSMFRGRLDSDVPAAMQLSTLVYRSRAVEPMSPDDLHRMVNGAQGRNRAQAVTGLLIYEGDQFFQWLEGPTENLAQVWRSIRHDKRHTDIEILGDAPTPVRFFPQWDMKLAAQRSDNLQTAMLAAAGLAASRSGSVMSTLHNGMLLRPAEQVVTAIADHPRTGDLARLLIAPDAGAASALVHELHDCAESTAQMCATLFEPAARALGDLWSSDDCSEFDVTLGLCRLQAAVRAQHVATSPRVLPGPRMHSVLVAPMPGELHALTATLDAEVLWQAGWDLRCECPDTDAALGKMLSSQWFDALDLSLSAAFAREHWLPRMARTIAVARASSRNPSLVVVVGGRAFFEQADHHQRVDAETACETALQIETVLAQTFRATV